METEPKTEGPPSPYGKFYNSNSILHLLGYLKVFWGVSFLPYLETRILKNPDMFDLQTHIS